MKIEIRGECVHISGYVNAVGRDSRPIPSQTGKFVEMIEPGTFGKALERAENVDLLLNHNKDRKLGSTSVGNLALNEDSIGLRAEADIRDAEVVDKARSGKLRGWSFGMYVKNAELENRAEDIPRRHVREIDLFEVSLIDDTMNPCYIGTSVECRADAEQLIETRGTEDSAHEINEIAPPDYSEYEGRINGLRAMGELRAYEERLQELRYNPYHDPTNGRFTGSNGAGGGMLFVGKGQKGKGAYVFESDKFETPSKIDIDSTSDEAFQKKSKELLKMQEYLPKRYKENLDYGDFSLDEYNEYMSEVLSNVQENQTFNAKSNDGLVKVKGTIFTYKNSNYGFGRTNGTDFVTDINGGKSISVKQGYDALGIKKSLSENIASAINVMKYLESLDNRAFPADNEHG